MNYRMSAIFAVLVSGLLAALPVSAFDINDSLGLRPRLNELDKLEARALDRGDQLEAKLIHDLHELLNHINEIASGQQKEFFHNVNIQQDQFYKNLDDVIQSMHNDMDDAVSKLQDVSNGFQNTLMEITRATKNPFLSYSEPSFIVKTGKPVLIKLHGAYLNGSPSLRAGQEDEVLKESTEPTVSFEIKDNDILDLPDQIAPESLTLLVDRPVSFWSPSEWFSGQQEYKVAPLIFPTKLGDVRIHVERTEQVTDSDKRVFGTKDAPFLALTAGNGAYWPPKTVRGQLSAEDIANKWEIVSGYPVKPSDGSDGADGRGAHPPQEVSVDANKKDFSVSCFASYDGHESVTCNLNVVLVVSKTYERKTEFNAPSLTDASGSNSWIPLNWMARINEPIPAGFDSREATVTIRYFDGLIRDYSGDYGRFVRISKENGYVVVNADTRGTNLEKN